MLTGRCEGLICGPIPVATEHAEIDRHGGNPAVAIRFLYLVDFTNVLFFPSLFAVSAPMCYLSLHPLLLSPCSDFNLRSRSLEEYCILSENEHVFKCTGRCNMSLGILIAPWTRSSGHYTMISPGTSGGLLRCHRKEINLFMIVAAASAPNMEVVHPKDLK